VRRLVPIAAGLTASFLQTAHARAQERCFTRLDNGVDLTGWRKSATNHHGPAMAGRAAPAV